LGVIDNFTLDVRHVGEEEFECFAAVNGVGNEAIGECVLSQALDGVSHGMLPCEKCISETKTKNFLKILSTLNETEFCKCA
jgi:hypothetical protein